MKKNLKRSLVVFLIGLFLIQPVLAKGHNGFHADNDVSLEKKITSTLFAAGNNVDVSSKVDRASFIAGNNLSISSKQDILFAAGNNINVKNIETKDAFLAASKISIDNSTIRDLYAMAENIRIDSNIERNVYLGGNSITINGTINGDCYIASESIRIGKEAQILGTLKYPENSKISISESAIVNQKEPYKEKTKNVSIKIDAKDMIISWIVSKLISFLTILVTGLVVLFLGKKIFKKMDKMKLDASTIIKNGLYGFIVLVGLPIASIMMLITIVGIPLALMAIAIYIMAIYLSIIATSYYLGTNLLKNKIKNKYLLLTVSLLILFVIKYIPIIGGLVSFLSLCIGLGLYFEVLKGSLK